MARVEQITEKSQLAAEWSPLFDRIAAARGRVAGPYSILLHAPAVADRVDQLSGALRSDTEVDAQGFVLAALAVARAKDCLFVWSVQAPNARRAGVSDDAIAAIRARNTNTLTEDQADIVSYAQQLATANRIDAATFDRLKARHGVRWLVELTTIAGHFGLICGINNAFDVPPSPQGDPL
ncbi:MAG TPA: carboxymuconolactone decarboxylase family protein [Chloroflexota bacterium]|jgi:4-carboxymuconolactone decarboxylase